MFRIWTTACAAMEKGDKKGSFTAIPQKRNPDLASAEPHFFQPFSLTLSDLP
jgi:hypothetical protein